ncbi:MAG: tetratricopeptide repeat protein [Sedimentisphaerales bacterium]|nr:tetratricopeptide repeat protein [Sedimentisphaerales bacterium]
MKKSLLLMVVLLLIGLGAFSVKAEEIEDIQDRAGFGAAQSMNNLARYEESVTILQDLFNKYPENLEVAFEYAKALGHTGQVDLSAKILTELRAGSYRKTETSLILAELLAIQKKYDQAIDICRDVLSQEPDNKDAELWLARFLSWDKQYDEALAVYDELIKNDPENLLYRREKARMLGWSREFESSIQQYREIMDLEKTDSGGVIESEMKAKQNFFVFYDGRAISNYKQWLEYEPKNMEALFESGQVYSRQMQWANAKDSYKKLLEILPSHAMGKQALDKTNILSELTRLTVGYSFYEADSGSRAVDKKYSSVFVKAKAPLKENWYLNMMQDNTFFSFNNVKQVYRHRAGVGLEYYQKPDFWAKAYYKNSLFSDGLKQTHNFGSELNYSPDDPWLINFSHQREDVIENYQTMAGRLQRDNYMTRLSYRADRKTGLGLDYMNSQYTDNNNRNQFGTDIYYYILHEPKSLKLSYRYEQYNFDRTKTNYFSPESFHTNSINLEWQHFLNKEEMFWGTDDTFYTVRYSVNFEPKQQVGHKIYVDLHHDWSNKCSGHLEWSKSIYDHRDIYSENRLMFYISLYF